MITIISENDVKQGSQEWLDLRSNFITGTDALSLLRGHTPSEIIFKKQHPAKEFKGNYWTRRGHILEDESKKIYSAVYEKVENAGFIINDKYPRIAYSPDGLVGDYGFVECKSFSEKNHLKTAESLSPAIVAQTQWGFFITERKWCDLLLYNPDLEDTSKAYIVKRLYPLAEIQNKFKKLLEL